MSTNALFVVAFVAWNFLVDQHYAFLTVQICTLVLLELGLQCRYMNNQLLNLTLSLPIQLEINQKLGLNMCTTITDFLTTDANKFGILPIYS